LPPVEMHAYLTARLIDLPSIEATPWLEQMLGVPGPHRITEPVRAAANRYLMELLESFAGMDPHLPDFRSGTEDHWARRWSRGFYRAVESRREVWDELRKSRTGAARALFFISMLDAPELYSRLSGRPQRDHAAFIEQNADKIPFQVWMLSQAVHNNRRLETDGLEDYDAAEADVDIELPAFTDEELRERSNAELVDLLSTLGDRVPENVIRECAARGEDIVPLLRKLLETYTDPERLEEEPWWGVLHCIHVLGLIPGASAGRALLEALRLREVDPEDELWDWVSGYWPALFANKIEHVRAGVTEIVAGRAHHWLLRADAMDCLGADSEEREASLDRIAGVAADETEEMDLRELAGGILLDYPRERHREMLLRLAEEQQQCDACGVHFDELGVLFAYGEPERPADDYFHDPWRFYDAENILNRQRRWRQEDREHAEHELLMDRPLLAHPETIVRGGPKIGRNDPCPCGSGKKYKKCCLAR